MKFNFIHLYLIVSVFRLGASRNYHHKHNQHHRAKNYFRTDYKAYRLDRDNNLVSFHDGLEKYELIEPPHYRESEIEGAEPVRHHIRHHPELSQLEIPWPVKKEALVEGDIVLGGLMMVHEREDTVTCGPVMPQGGIQALEAMLFTLDKLNEGPSSLLPNITIGAHILDDCDKDTYGLEMAVDFIKGKKMNIICVLAIIPPTFKLPLDVYRC